MRLLHTWSHVDKALLSILVTLLLVGLISVSSASFYVGDVFGVSAYYFLRKQIFWDLLALGVMVFLMFFDYRKWRYVIRFLWPISLLLLLLVFVPGVGHSAGGATRWINLRLFLVNPSELAKLILVIYLANVIARKQTRIRDFTFGLLPQLLITGSMFFIVLMQSGFSIAVILLLVSLIMLFIGGISWRHVALIGAIALPIMGLMVYRVAYRLDRVMAYLDPWADPMGVGYHLVQSLKALATGSWFGLGLGNSISKVSLLPTPHTDFIFAVIVEETGFLGGACLLLLFLLFCIRGLRVALYVQDRFGQLLAFGVVALVALHALLNVSIVMGLLPPTGVSLPFISYGGSALLVFSAASGILLNISSHMPIHLSDPMHVEG